MVRLLVLGYTPIHGHERSSSQFRFLPGIPCALIIPRHHLRLAIRPPRKHKSIKMAFLGTALNVVGLIFLTHA